MTDTDTPIPGDEFGGWDPEPHRDFVDALVFAGEWSLDDQETE